MPKITEAELKSKLKTGDFSHLYFIYGNETFFKQHYCRAISGAVVDAAQRDFNLQQFNRDADLDDVITAVTAMPLLSDRKCVILCDFDADAAKAEALKKFMSLLENPSEDCVLICWFDSVTVNLKTSSKWKNVLAAAQKNGNVLELNQKSEAEIIRILCHGAKKRGCELPAKAAQRLIETSGKNLQNLQCELDKLCAYRPGGVIDEEAIRLLATVSIEASVFELAQDMINQKANLAYQKLDNLLVLMVDPVEIFSVLSKYYVNLYRAKIAMQNGNLQEILQAYDYKSKEFMLKRAAASAEKQHLKRIKSSLLALFQADMALKSSKIEKRIILEQLIARLCVA